MFKFQQPNVPSESVSQFHRLFGVVMGVALLLTTLYFVCSATPIQSRLVKRIANGYPLDSHQDYGTYHFISLREMYRCVSDQMVHELGGCTEKNACGGTLFHPEFVITAAHCADHKEYYLRESSEIYRPQSQFIFEEPDQEEEGTPIGEVNVQVVNFQLKHAFYSNTALLAGSANLYVSEQKRHAHKVFPHPEWQDFRRTKYFQHDVAIIQACQPFAITSHVRLAPVKPLNDLPAQFESLVKNSAMCLYVGFGDTGDQSSSIGAHLQLKIQTKFLRFTWRYTTCMSRCYFNEGLKWDKPRNPCFLCSDYIPPTLGMPLQGDSGGPIVCNGYYVGVITGGVHEWAKNVSKNRGYPLHCIKDAITADRLDHYRTIPPGQRRFPYNLGPVQKYYDRK